MANKLVFISHITEESTLAKLISDSIKSYYLNMLDTFVSSDGDSIKSGERWVDKITTALESSVVQLIICSPFSIHRPWINFEAGAAWIRKIPVIPICHSGLYKSNLPIPLSLLESCDLENVSDLTSLFNTLTNTLGSSEPYINYHELVSKVKDFSDEYIYYSKIRNALSQLKKVYPNFIDKLMTVKQFNTEISDLEKSLVFPHLNILKNMKIIILYCGGMTITAEQNSIPCSIRLSQNITEDKYNRIFNDLN